MLRKAIIVGIGTLLGVNNIYADFATDFQSAVKLYNEQKDVEAQEAFVKLAGVAPTPKAKAESMSYAASSLSRQKKYDEALALAKKIQVGPISVNCQMGLMLEDGKCKELLAAFKDEDIGAWPDYCIHQGYYRRGMAYLSVGDAQDAAKDLELAAANAVGTEDIMFQARTYKGLGAAYQALKEDQKALDAYRKVSSFTRLNSTWTYIDSVIASARILSSQGKHDDALSELQKLAIGKDDSYDRFVILQTRGDIREAQGKLEEALRDYNEAVGFKKVPQACIDALNKKIKSLEMKSQSKEKSK